MSNRLHCIMGVLALAFVARDAAAQWNVARFPDAPNRFYTAFGLDPALVTTVGYGRVVSVRGHSVQFTGEGGIAAAGLEASDYRVRIQALTSVARWRDVHLTGSASFITRGTKNAVYEGVNFGSDLTGTLGVYRAGWFAAGEFGFDKAIVTHVSHADWYRQFYPDARDGWYLDAGGTYHYGVTSGIAVGLVEVAGRFGWQRTEKFNELVPPMYASLGTGVRF